MAEVPEIKITVDSDVAIKQAMRVFDEHMKKVAHRVIDVFENADEDTLADEIMQDVFEAIGIVENFTRPSGEDS